LVEECLEVAVVVLLPDPELGLEVRDELRECDRVRIQAREEPFELARVDPGEVPERIESREDELLLRRRELNVDDGNDLLAALAGE
jgi:hypothetical protein